MRPRKLSDEGRAEIEAVALARYSTPSDKELATKHGVSPGYVWKLMSDFRRKVGKPVVSRGSNTEDNYVLVPVREWLQRNDE